MEAMGEVVFVNHANRDKISDGKMNGWPWNGSVERPGMPDGVRGNLMSTGSMTRVKCLDG
jgi:hypothetical protein